MAEIYPNLHNTSSKISNLVKLYNNSIHIRVKILYKIPYKIKQDKDPMSMIFIDSAWTLILYIGYGDNGSENRSDNDSLDDSSGGSGNGSGSGDSLLCVIGYHGNKIGLDGKHVYDHTNEELALECWGQITNTQHNLKLSSIMPNYNIFYEEKNSNNVNILPYLPNIRDEKIRNLYNASYSTSTVDRIYNIESECESGNIIANLIKGRIECENKYNCTCY
jgi:hypothetical protein